ncbi:dolichyl-P-Man:Man7GlcNAc2-PP-dolichol alpha-1,6-mannosyltransferase [Malassezia sp. CBS 17886]|nr:dolichyl-P-Man:Man7GlcNAc2-PP-dolichol alpha-1,6-mannosyltransferase [Malassezia sp. CBS 17886]
MRTPVVSTAALVLALCAPAALVPYTKVEESFSLQAVHDILTHGLRRAALAEYDHVVFPGAVPRSFVGPLLLAAAGAPSVLLARALGASSAAAQTSVRVVLAVSNALALVALARALFPRAREQAFFFWLCAAQFRLAFWLGRTTPNSVAFPLVVSALAGIASGRHLRASLGVLAACALVLRAEVAALAAPVYLWTWLRGRLSFVQTMRTGALAAAAAVALSVAVDSYFWAPAAAGRRWMWPELHALLFNVVDGKSSEWGTSPPYAYWTRELPRLLSFSLPLALGGAAHVLYCARGTALELVATLPLVHTGALSLLAHKEWRFLMYTVPLWNVCSTVAVSALLRHTFGWRRRLAAGVLLAVVLSAATNVLFCAVSSLNYPGGYALRALHEHVDPATPVRVHIDTRAAMTGVSLFQSTHLQRPSTSLVPRTDAGWVYDKTEGLATTGDLDALRATWGNYTHIITEETECGEALSTLFRPLLPPVVALHHVGRLLPLDGKEVRGGDVK